MLLALLLVAAPIADTADAEVQRAVELYRAFKIPEGIKVLGKALQRSTLAPAQRARVYIYVGVGEAGRGDDAAARRAFEQAFAYDASVELPDIASPKTRQMFEQMKPQAPATPTPSPTPAPVVVEPPPPAPPQVVIEPAPPPSASTTKWWIAPMAAGVISLAVASVMLGVSESNYTRLTSGEHISLGDTMALISSGKTFQTGAWVGFIAAGVLTALAVMLGLIT